MAKNILLLFLSYVNPNGNTIYNNLKNKEGTKNSNESSVRYLLENGCALDKIFIIASKEVKKPISNYRYENGNEVTHLDYFKARMTKKFWPKADYAECSYNEDSTDDEKLKRVAEIARDIQGYAAQFKGEEIILHIDLTGGMRDVNIMMLDLTRLLHYSGLKVEKLLYSDFGKKEVEELRNIYDLFQLIAGVEEFVNFGSVNALEKYYKDKTCSEQLKRLRAAMKNFAEAIKLCHYWQFKEAIENLHKAVRDFKPASEDVQDILMERLIGKIREDYRKLIVNRAVDAVEIIGWCLDHDYLQQALTLYNERIPEYLGEKKFIVQTEEEEKKLTHKIKQDKMRNRFFYLINVDTPHRDYQGKASKIFCDAVKSEAAGKKNIDVDAWLDELDKKISSLYSFIDDKPRLRSQLEIFNEIRQTPDDLLRDLDSSKLDPIREIIKTLSEKLAAEKNPAKRGKIILNFVAQLENEEFKKYKTLSEKLAAEKNPIKREKIILNFVAQLENKEFKKYFPKVVLDKKIKAHCPDKLRVMIREGIFRVTIAEEKFLSIMDKYFRIQSERNQSNHAYDESQKELNRTKPHHDSGEFETAEDLRETIREAITEIKDNLPTQ